MRVIAGIYRGRRLLAPEGPGTRPTSDRVKEALFSMLGDLSGLVVLDLFAGTGALAIEALSRGASRAVLVERDERALAALRENLQALGLGSEQAQIRRRDALQALREASKLGETYDLVFVDPPYARASALQAGLSALLGGVLAPDARVVLERDRRSALSLPWQVERERNYGDTSITILRQR